MVTSSCKLFQSSEPAVKAWFRCITGSSVIFVLIYFLVLVLVFQFFSSFSFVLVLQYFFVLVLVLLVIFSFSFVSEDLLMICLNAVHR